MTVHDDVRFFDAAVESVLRQDLSDLELIIVDDGGHQHDQIAPIAGRDPRIRLITGPENVGPAAAANRGIACARAGIIARLDADDVAEPTRLRRLVSMLDADPRLGLVGTWFATITEEGQTREIIRLPTSDLEIRWCFLFFNPFCHSSVAFRRACFEAAGGYRAELRTAEDYDLWARMLTICRAANIPEPLTRYRQNSRGLTSTHGIDPAFLDRLRGACWKELRVPYDPDAARAIGVFVSGYDIPPADRPERALATMLRLLRRFLAKPGPLPRDEDQAVARRLVDKTLAHVRSQPTFSFAILLETWRLRLNTLSRFQSPASLPIFTSEGSDRRRIKVLVVIPTLNVGGAEMDLVRNLPLLDRTMFEVVVCTLLERGVLATRLSEAGIAVVGPFRRAATHWMTPLGEIRRRLRRWLAQHRSQSTIVGWTIALIARSASWIESLAFGTYAYLACVRPLADHMRKGEYDIVHTVLPFSYLYGAWANRLATCKPLVMSRVSLNWYQESARFLGHFERSLLHSRVDAVICNSAMIMRQLESEGVDRSKIRVIYNGIDFSARPPLPIERRSARNELGLGQDELVLSTVGTLWAYKGHADLLAALHQVIEQLPPGWKLLVVGRDIDNNLRWLHDLCARLELAAHVRFLGERLDISSILSAADIHVSASHTEGFPNNILEAMGSGLPVVATAVGGVPELVIDGETGLLVPPHDPRVLGAAVLKLAGDHDLRARMGRRSYERAVANFSVERSAAALADVYRSTAASAR